jgi:hypothetical protein
VEDQLFGERGFRAGLDEYGQGILRELAPLAMGPVLGRAIQVLPRASLFTAGDLTVPSRAGQPSEAVMQLQ